MKKKIVSLNEEERYFAQKNHNIIYDFLHKNKLCVEEYYDLASIGYVIAVANYCRRPELRKYAFTTIAWPKMRTEVGNYQDHVRRTGIKEISMDEFRTDHGESLEDILGFSDKAICEVEFWTDIEKALDQEEVELVRKLIEGHVSTTLGITNDRIHYQKVKIRKKLRA